MKRSPLPKERHPMKRSRWLRRLKCRSCRGTQTVGDRICADCGGTGCREVEVWRRQLGKPLKRTHMKKVNRKRGGSAFPKRRDYVFQKWVRANAPCILAGQYRPLGTFAGIGAVESHRCTSPVRVCHIKSRGAGGDDRGGNIYGGCDSAHDEQHRIGIPAFEKRWQVDLKAEAARLWAEYVGASPGARTETP